MPFVAYATDAGENPELKNTLTVMGLEMDQIAKKALELIESWIVNDGETSFTGEDGFSYFLKRERTPRSWRMLAIPASTTNAPATRTKKIPVLPGNMSKMSAIPSDAIAS